MDKKIWEISDPVFEVDDECPMYRSWPWHGHRLFAYDLVHFMAPRLIVELGTYWGTSFFSFCQSIKDFGLSSRCIAIDTWEGDDHTGDYSEDVFQAVQSRSANYFPHVSTELLRMRFEEALDRVEEQSVDLLHIDGYHTYEAVSEDYRSWLPKLTENGIVLFHDIADECDYGSVRFWKEISAEHPSYTFQHSWGLGVLFPKGDALQKRMELNDFRAKMEVYANKSELLFSRLEVADLDRLSRARDDRIKELEKLVERESVELREAQDELQRIKSSSVYRLLGWMIR